jgi:endothelin-converting enzyme/putative endopeptidase
MIRLRMKLLFLAIPIFAIAAFSADPNSSPAPADSAAPKLEHFDPTLPDMNLDPCTDFYKYSCSKWISSNPIPADQVAWSTGSGLQYWNENILRETLEGAAAAGGQSTPLQRQLGSYWQACINTDAINKAGLRYLQPELAQINAMKNKAELAELIAHHHLTLPGAWQQDDNQTDTVLFGFDSQPDFDDASIVIAAVDQAGLGMPSRDFYLNTDAKSVEIRNAYEKHVAKMFELADEEPPQAAADAKTVLSLETALARAQVDNVTRRDPKSQNNKMSLQQLRALTPSFNWDEYLRIVGAPAPKHYIVTSPKYFTALEKEIKTRPLSDWKTYLRWYAIHDSAPHLPTAFVDENWDFFSRVLNGAKQQRPRWRRCVAAADRDLGNAVGQAYVARAFPPESKARMLEMVHDIETALDRDIDTLDWMSPATRQQAKVKLQGMVEKIGYPDQWIDYSSVKVTPDSYLKNVHATTDFEFRRQLAKIGKPANRREWTMTPPTINAYNDPPTNTINFPAGILQPPYFELSKDDAVNYGAIGMVIGHEIIHGFDDQGRKFDDKGNLRDWWTDADGKQYETRGKCIVDQYSQEVPEAGVKQNGELTLGEDTADNGGIRLALMALEEKLKRNGKTLDDKGDDGWTYRQRFFLSFANSWCGSYRPELTRTVVLTDPHSLPRYRVNNPISNTLEFRQAFGCKAGAPMARENACRVW